jgi:hypothetical protein
MTPVRHVQSPASAAERRYRICKHGHCLIAGKRGEKALLTSKTASLIRSSS